MEIYCKFAILFSFSPYVLIHIVKIKSHEILEETENHG